MGIKIGIKKREPPGLRSVSFTREGIRRRSIRSLANAAQRKRQLFRSYFENLQAFQGKKNPKGWPFSGQ